MKSILNAHPFFSNFFCPSPVSLDVDGLTPSSGRTFLYGVLLVFAIFIYRRLLTLFHVYYKEWHEITCTVQTDISHIIACTWMVVQAEEASLAKLCRKLVVIILL